MNELEVPASRPREPPGRTSPRRPISSAITLFRTLPLALVAIGIVALLARKANHGLFDRTAPGQGEAPGDAAWRLIGDGETEFLGVARPLQIHRRSGGEERYRIETPSSALENQSFDGVIQSFVREAVAGVRPGESLRIRFRRAGVFGGAGGSGEQDLVEWQVSIVEERRAAEVWYRIESRPLEARSTEDLKQHLAREVARSVWSLFHGDFGG